MLERKVQILCFDETIAAVQLKTKLDSTKKDNSLREDIKNLFRSSTEIHEEQTRGLKFEVSMVWKD